MGFAVKHNKTPGAITVDGELADCVVVDTGLANAEIMLENARAAGVRRISIVSDLQERYERLAQGDHDSFQRRVLESEILAARIAPPASAVR